MMEIDKELAAVSVEEVSPEALARMNVIAKVDENSSEIDFVDKADSVLQVASNVIEVIPEKGLFKVEVPEGSTLQDLASVKGDEGAFRAIVKGSDGKIAGQAKLREAAKLNPSQVAGVGLAAAAMVVGQAYMTEISDTLHGIDEKLDKISSMIADEQKAKLMNSLDIARIYSSLYDDYRKNPDALRAARGEVERCYNDVGVVIDWMTLQLGGLEKRAREAKANEKELKPLVEELHSYENQFALSLKVLSALAMTRMLYDGAADERNSLIERERIVDKSRGFLKEQALIAGSLEVKIGSLKGAPVALPRGNTKNPLKNLTSMTPRAAAKKNLLDSKVCLQSDLRASQGRTKAAAASCSDGIKQIATMTKAARTVLTDGSNCWLVEEIDR